MTHILIFIHWFVFVFTFGNVELVTIDNSKSNDFPIEELNGYTLNELFANRNMAVPVLSNAIDLGNGVYRYKTQDGITMDYNINNGYIILNGTKTLGLNALFLDLYRNDIPNETIVSFKYYYVSGTFDSNTEYSFLFANSNNNPGGQPLKNGSDYIETIFWQNYEYNYTSAIPRIFLGNGTITFDNFIFKVQLEYGTIITPYEVPTNGPYNTIDLSTLNITIQEVDDWYNIYLENAQREISDTYDYIENELTTNDLIYIVLFALLWGLAIKIVKGVM